jgi:5-hydroxyisourate hydrolase
MPAKLSTHVLNLATGRPAAGMRIELWRRSESPKRMKALITNVDGRTDEPLLGTEEIKVGDYELVFFAKEYFADNGLECVFLSEVPVRFTITDAAASYHVPLLVTPWSYSTYRGS